MKIISLKNLVFFSDFRGKNSLLGDEEGSAVVEFLVLGLPLFLPLVLFLSHINNESNLHIQSKNFARQVVRAYVTSPTEQYAEMRVQKVIEVFRREIFQRNSEVSSAINSAINSADNSGIGISSSVNNPATNSTDNPVPFPQYIPKVKISCSQYPCLQRGSKVRATVTVSTPDNRVVATASADEFVDLWRSS